MNFEQTIKNLNRSLSKKQPLTFNPSWIKKRIRKSYDFIVENIKNELNEPDWDQIICCLDYDYQKLWLKGPRRKREINLYEDRSELEAILNRYKNKLYTFLAQTDKDDKKICNEISIRLVRTAQKGNVLAKQKAMIFIRQLINHWIDVRSLERWRGYDDLIEKNIDQCIRCYRYSGSFLVYLYRTLEYAGRGLRTIEAFSLDEYSPITERRKSDNLVYDLETGETRLFSSNR